MHLISEVWVGECMAPYMTWQDVTNFYSLANRIAQEMNELDMKIMKCKSELHPLMQLQMILEEPDLWLTESRFQEN